MEYIQQDLPFDELKPKTVDVGKLLYFPKPKNDNECLLNFQKDFYNGDKSALNKIYKLGFEIAYKMINQTVKENKHIKKLTLEEREEKAHNAITYIIERYLTVSNFVINTSMTSYIYLRVKHELFYKRKCDDLVQFVDWTDFKGV